MKICRQNRLIVVVGLLVASLFIQSSCTTTQNTTKLSYKNNVVDKTKKEFKVEYPEDYKIVETNVTGTAVGFNVVPMIPLPYVWKYSPSIFENSPSLIRAEMEALNKSGGDFLVNKRVENQSTFLLFFIGWKKLTVVGDAAKLKTKGE